MLLPVVGGSLLVAVKFGMLVTISITGHVWLDLLLPLTTWVRSLLRPTRQPTTIVGLVSPSAASTKAKE